MTSGAGAATADVSTFFGFSPKSIADQSGRGRCSDVPFVFNSADQIPKEHRLPASLRLRIAIVWPRPTLKLRARRTSKRTETWFTSNRLVSR
jgi:hypothetical protein